MKIRTYSFKLVEGPIPAKDFFDFLIADEKNSYAYNGSNRLIYLKEHNAVYTALILSPKDQKTFLAIQKDGEKLQIKRTELEEGTQLCDFNIMIYNHEQKNGVYTHYHGGMSLDTLQGYLNLFYRRCKRKTIQKEEQIKLIASGIDVEDVEAALEERDKGDLAILPVYRSEEIEELIQELSEIRCVTVSTQPPGDDDAVCPFDSADLDYVNYRWKIKGSLVDDSGLKDKLLAYLRRENITDGTIRGRKQDQPIKDIPFKFDPVAHDESDFDEILSDFEIEPKDFETTEIYNKTKAVAIRIGVVSNELD